MPYVTVDEHLDEGARECGEESAAASSHRQSLALGGVAKIVVAFAASAGLAACALEWKGFLSRPSLRQSSTGAAVRLAEDQSFDCFDEIRDWRHAWSAPKKEYCCLQTHVGCRSDEPLETGTVGVLQLDEITKFPVQVQTTDFDCSVGYNNWESAWPRNKQRWCCSNFFMGCKDDEQEHAAREARAQAPGPSRGGGERLQAEGGLRAGRAVRCGRLGGHRHREEASGQGAAQALGRADGAGQERQVLLRWPPPVIIGRPSRELQRAIEQQRARREQHSCQSCCCDSGSRKSRLC